MATNTFVLFAIFGYITKNIGLIYAANPTFSGMYPVLAPFNEDAGTPAGTVLHTFTATDADGVTPILNYTFDPTTGSDMFKITETVPITGTTKAQVALAAGKTFNYETLETYKIYVNAFDGVNYAGKVLLTISVTDVGEAPTFKPATTEQSFEIDESPLGTTVGHPSFVVEDLDLQEVHNWTITGGTGQGYLTMLPTNGTILFSVDYDREDNTKPAIFYVDVAVTDKYGLSATTTFSVTVNDINDKAPVFTNPPYTYNVDLTTPINTNVATLIATDDDATSPNNAITYSMQLTSISEYFAVNDSRIELKYAFDIVYGSGPYTFLVYAVDGGSPAKTGTTTMTITTSTTTTDPTTTTILPPPGYSFNENSTNVMLIIICCALAALVVGYVLVLCWRFHTYKRCLPERCITSADCDKCCDCCDSDADSDDEMVVFSKYPPPSKGSPLGFEAPNSKKPSRSKY